MTNSEAIRILCNEIKCVKRPDCERSGCGMCDLAMNEEDILEAYEIAIDALRRMDDDCK